MNTKMTMRTETNDLQDFDPEALPEIQEPDLFPEPIEKREPKIIIVSNRLPIGFEKNKENNSEWQLKPNAGGLITALAPTMKGKKGIWIGWSGITEEGAPLEELLKRGSDELGYTLVPVSLTPEEYNKHYLGCSNEIIWPLFHDLASRANFDPTYWSCYEAVNHKFAETILKNSEPNDYIWIHDYHLMLAARELRLLSPGRRTGFFLHIPFPPLDIFLKLPWRRQVLRALLEFDLLGFQSIRDKKNFLNCVSNLVKGVRFDARNQITRIKMPNRAVKVGVFPISIDFNEFADKAILPGVKENTISLRKAFGDGKIMMGIDRLDYSKGVPERLKAFRTALESYPTMHGKVTLVQLLVPSREDIPQYQTIRVEIERLVSEINGKFGQPGWTPIQYMFRSLERNELVAYYCAADIALVTPLKDGMNLVAKEYCAANNDENAVLILSEFAGAAHQLGKYALTVNPYDIVSTADAIYRAYEMPIEERRQRMRNLRRCIRERDIYWWLERFLKAAAFEPVIKKAPYNRYTIPAGTYKPEFNPLSSYGQSRQSWDVSRT